MKRIFKTAAIVFFAGMCLGGCKTHTSNAFYTFETECMGDEFDGSVVLRAWGQGSSRSDALEKAKKKALYDIIFTGVRKGQCNFKPLVTEANAEEKYQSYFNRFFSDKGDYVDYIKMDATKMGSGEKSYAKTRNSYAAVVRVLRAELMEKLRNDNILK